MPWRRTIACLFPCVFTIAAYPAAERPIDPPSVDELKHASNDELASRFQKWGTIFYSTDTNENVARDRVLGEIGRRGGREWEALLTARLFERRADDLFAEDRKQGPDADGKPPAANLEILTTLRRMQGKLDPLHVVVDREVNEPLACDFPSLPALNVALVNQDAEKTPVRFINGGDYRSGRPARWRVEVRNAAGKEMPVRDQFGDEFRGGLFNDGELAFDERWRTTLEMSSFVPPLPPGDYRVRVLYHDGICISEQPQSPDALGLVTSRSQEFDLKVRPRVVVLANERDRVIRNTLAEIPVGGELRIVVGTYGTWAHNFVKPDSPQGRLLRFGFDAVPALLTALDDRMLPPQRRALVLSLLFSITGANDPRHQSGIVGDCTYVEGVWAVWGEEAGGMGLGGSGSISRSHIDLEKQHEFAKRWSDWKRYVLVERPASDAD